MTDWINIYASKMLACGYLSQASVEAYTSDLRVFEKWHCRHRVGARWSKVCAADVTDFVEFLISEEYEHSTVCRMLSALSSLYDYFVSEKMMRRNPVKGVRRPRPKYHERESLSMEVVREVLAQSNLTVATRALISLISESGLRIGECLSLCPDDLDLDYCQVRVLGKGNAERIAFFGPTTKRYLEEYLHECPCLKKLFPETRRQYNWDIWHAFQPFVGAHKVSPHILRHTFATECLSNGMPMDVLMLTLGHKSIDTTMLYTHCKSVRSDKFNRQFGARV